MNKTGSAAAAAADYGTRQFTGEMSAGHVSCSFTGFQGLTAAMDKDKLFSPLTCEMITYHFKTLLKDAVETTVPC